MENGNQTEEPPLLPFSVSGRWICFSVQIKYLILIKIQILRAGTVLRSPYLCEVCNPGMCVIKYRRLILEKNWGTKIHEEKSCLVLGIGFKAEKQFSAMNCSSFISISHDSRAFFNHSCLHVDSLNHPCAAAKDVLCMCLGGGCYRLCLYDA